MWRGSQTLRPGRIEVVVLPPFDTSGWSVRDINARVEEIRTAFLHTLAHWPGRPSAPEFDSPDPREVRS